MNALHLKMVAMTGRIWIIVMEYCRVVQFNLSEWMASLQRTNWLVLCHCTDTIVCFHGRVYEQAQEGDSVSGAGPQAAAKV